MRFAGKFITNTSRYLLLVFVSIAILVFSFIAFPQTEKLLPNTVFDLSPKDYWSKEYILEVTLFNNEQSLHQQQLELSKSVIARRLSRLGVEEIKVYEIDKADPKVPTETEMYRYLQVNVKSSIEQSIVDEVVRTRNFIRFYTPKEGVNFDDEENVLAQYLPENYNEVDLTSWDFRNFDIKKLPTTTGGDSYFVVFKPEFFNYKFAQFAKAQASNRVGVGIDGFISQTTMPSQFAAEPGQGAKGVFAISVGNDPQRARISDVLYNSGVIPLSYSVTTSTEIATRNTQSNYLYLLIIIIVALTLYSVFMKLFQNESIKTIITRIGGTLIVLAIWISAYKLIGMPVDFTIMFAQSIMLIIVSEAVLNSDDPQFRTIVIAGLFYFLSWTTFGYLAQVMRELSALTLALYLVQSVLNYYLINMKKYLLNE